MREFLNSQFDYIYFFYGFSFFLLALICFTLSKEKLREFPWILLGMFGLFHGFHEWMDMLAVVSGENRFISITNLFLLTLSYLCLLEFSRAGLIRLKRKTISRWVYLVIILFIPFALFYGLNGWAIMARYLLGFPAVYLCARVIFEFAEIKKTERRALTTLSLILALYAVFTGIVVNRAPFFPANFINLESFNQALGIPAELARGILALFAALSIWFYSSTPFETEYSLKRSIRFAPTKWMVASTLIVFITAGWIFTNYLDYYAGIQVIKRNKTKAASGLNILTNELERLSRAVISLSKSSMVRIAVSPSSPAQNIEKTRAVIEKFKNKFSALNCSLLDIQGLPIISEGNANSEIQMGKSYALTPYFRDALKNDTGYYFKLSAKSNERLYYVSYPVKNLDGKTAGVIVIVKNIRAEPLFQYRLFSIIITFLLCIIAIIFFLALRKREAAIRFIEKVHARLEEVDRMKTDLISTVSHEFRTPLTSIKNAAGILMKGGPLRRALDKTEKEMLEIILDNVERQSRMVNDLLDVSKLEAGVMPIQPKPLELSILMHQTVNALRPLAEKKIINLVLDDKTRKVKVFADPELVRRILNNLLSNAINNTPSNGKITLSSEEMGKEIIITVCDTGIGISEEGQKNLFKKFCVIPAETGQQKKGCGLGLAITKGLVEAQKGRIWVNSKLRGGASFHFTLPKV